MYREQIEKVIKAINSGRSDLAQFYLSDLLLNPSGDLKEDAKAELLEAIPGSKIVFGGVSMGVRAGYLEYNSEKYYFA